MDFDDFSFPAQPPATAEATRQPDPLPSVEPMPTMAPLPAQQAASLVRATSPTAQRAKAGLGVLAAALGAGIGGVLGGPLGAAAGLTGVGTVRNLYRSQGIASSDPTERGDAARSLALGVVGVAIVGYLGYKLYNSSKD